MLKGRIMRASAICVIMLTAHTVGVAQCCDPDGMSDDNTGSEATAVSTCNGGSEATAVSTCNGGKESRPVTGLYGVELGSKSTLSTYLSPLTYSGINYSLAGNWQKALPAVSGNLLMEFDAEASFAQLINKSKTAYEYALDVRFGYGLKWRHRLPHGLQITAGGELDLQGGVLYLTRNSNNPAAALASISLAPTFGASYHFNIKRLPVLITEQVRIPSLGVFFSPEYGETYYEIYLGNYSGLAHAGWWGNNFRIDNMLCATLDFGRTAMTVGYRFRADTSWVCNLNTQIFTHSFVLGVIPGGIGLKKKHKNTNYALY